MSHIPSLGLLLVRYGISSMGWYAHTVNHDLMCIAHAKDVMITVKCAAMYIYRLFVES